MNEAGRPQRPTGKISRTSSSRAGHHEECGNADEGVCLTPQGEIEGIQKERHPN